MNDAAVAALPCETRPTRTLRLVVNSENAFKVSVAQQIAAAFSCPCDNKCCNYS